MCSLAKSKAKYKEMKDTKEEEIVALKDELTASKGRCEAVESELIQRSNRCVCVSVHTCHSDTTPMIISLCIII